MGLSVLFRGRKIFTTQEEINKLLHGDVQADFINENTKPILNEIIELIDSKTYNKIAFTRFINDKNSIWYRKLNYKGCMTNEGQKIALFNRRVNMAKKKNEIEIRSSAAEYLTYVAAIGDNPESIEVRYEDENIWITQKMLATLYDVNVATNNKHISNIYKDNELEKD